MARLSKEARREQLLALGTEMITASGFDQFSIDDLAARAEISRSLLFHYFDNRQDFLVAVAEREAQAVLDVTNPDPDLEPPAQLLAGISGFLDYLADRGDQYVALVRGAAGGDPAMQAVFSRTRDALAERIIERASEMADVPHLARIAARGQIALAEEVIVSWLVTPEAQRESRDQIVLFLALSTVDLLRRAGVDLDDDLITLVDGLTAA